MKTFIVALALCLLPTMALADGEVCAPDPSCVTVCCQGNKPVYSYPALVPTVKKKPRKKKPVVVKPAPKPEPAPCQCQKPHACNCPAKPPVIVVIQRPLERVAPPPVCKDKGCRKEPKVIVGGYVALGVGVRDQYVQGNVGLQLEFPKAYLGLRVFTALDKGVGFQALLYPYRGDKLKVHILDPGVLVTGDPFNYTNNTDVPRRVDLIFGAGIQYRLLCNLDLTADWRVNIADPGMLADRNGVLITSGPRTGQFLDAPHVVGNSFSSSQVLVGLLLHL